MFCLAVSSLMSHENLYEPTLKETRYLLLLFSVSFCRFMQKRCKVSKKRTFLPYLFGKKMNKVKKHGFILRNWHKKLYFCIVISTTECFLIGRYCIHIIYI